MRQNISLTEGPIPKALLLFSLPILFGNVLQTLNGSVNAVWVGRYLGESAFAAAGNANSVLGLLFAAIFGFSMATTIMVAQCVGAKNLAEAKKVVGTSACFFALLSLALSIAGLLLTRDLLAWLHTPADALAPAIAYMRIIFLALPFMSGFFFLMAVLRGSGDSRTPFAFLALSVGLDIALNPLLIFGWGPVPRLGIAGSATATLTAQAVSLTALIVHLYRSKNALCIGPREWRTFVPEMHLVRLLFTKGVPMGLQMLVITSSMLALTALVNRFGSQETAAFNAAVQLWNYVLMPAVAIGAAVSSMAGQNVGAGRWDRVNRIAVTGVAFNFLLSGVLIALLYLLDREALGLFLPAASEALEIAAHLNAVVVWSFAFFGVSVVLFGVVRASGAVVAPLAMLVVSLWLVRVPFAYLLVDRWQANAIWLSYPVGAIASMVMAIAYYRWGGWRTDRIGIATRRAMPAQGA